MKKTSFTHPERTLLGLGHALDALEYLGREKRAVALSEIAAALAMSKAGVHRVLATLQARGYVEWRPGGRYRLGIKAWELGCRVEEVDAVKVAAPFMQELTSRTGESTQLGHRSGFEVVYLHAVLAPQAVRVHVDAGVRLPANWSSTGIVLLAFMNEQERARVMPSRMQPRTESTITDPRELEQELKRVRERGYALGIGIWRSDVVGVSAPVFGPDGQAIAALNLAGPRYRIPRDKLLRLREATVRSASSITEALRGGRASLGESRPGVLPIAA